MLCIAQAWRLTHHGTMTSPFDPFASYDSNGYFCELTTRPGDGGAIERVRQRVSAIGLEALRARAAGAEHDLINLGITFTVYSEAEAIDRILPFDCLPRIITASEWRHIEAGVKQRVRALNSFLHDIYHERHILREGVIPAALVLGNSNYRPEMEGFRSVSAPTSISAASTSCATSTGHSASWKTMRGRRPACHTSSKTVTSCGAPFPT